MIIINHLRLDADDWMMHHHLDERDGQTNIINFEGLLRKRPFGQKEFYNLERTAKIIVFRMANADFFPLAMHLL